MLRPDSFFLQNLKIVNKEDLNNEMSKSTCTHTKMVSLNRHKLHGNICRLHKKLDEGFSIYCSAKGRLYNAKYRQ